MIDSLQSLSLELDTLDASSLDTLEAEECGIIVSTPAWDCYLGYPFPKGHLHILLGLGVQA